MYEKDFENWLKLKEKLNNNNPPFFNEREIWWCSVGENIGDEENGKNKKFLRPVLIIKKFNKNICYAVPLSTKLKENNPYYLDMKRLHGKMGKISNIQFKKIKSSIKELF